MSRFSAYMTVLTLCMLLLPLSAARAQDSCGCTTKDFEVRRQEAAAIFVGTVQEIKIIEEYRKPATVDMPVAVTILIDDGYKNAKNGEKFTLHTSLTRDTCTGHPFEQWKKYLIFAYERKTETYEYWSLYNFPSGTYDVGGLCGGTQLISAFEAGSDLAVLRALQKDRDQRTLEKEKKK